MRGLDDILEDLLDWATGRSIEGFVLPQVYHSREAREDKRVALRDKVPDAISRSRHLDTAAIDLEGMDADTAEAIGLAVIIQVYDFLRDGAWEAVDNDHLIGPLTELRRDLGLLPPLMRLLEQDAADSDRSPVVKKLVGLQKHLLLLVREGKERAVRRTDMLDDEDSEIPESLTSFDSVPDSDSLGDDDDDDDNDDDAMVAAMATDFQDRVKDALEVANGLETAARQPGPGEEGTIARVRRHARRVAPLIVGVLLICALVSVWPLLSRRTLPTVDDYSEFLPVLGLSRPVDTDRELVLVVDARWNAMGEAQRIDGARTLFEFARDAEGMFTVIVRDQQGLDVAQATAAGVELLP